MSAKTTVENGPIKKSSPTKANRCDKCKLKDVTTCPLQEHAWEMFKWEGLQHCSMGDAIDKMILAIRVDNRFLNSREMKKN